MRVRLAWSLEHDDPARVRELVATTQGVSAALKQRLGNRITETPVIARLDGEGVLEIAMERADFANVRWCLSRGRSASPCCYCATLAC